MADEKQLVVNLALKSGTMKQQINSINKDIKQMQTDFKNAGAGVEDFEKTSEGLSTKLKLQQSVVEKLKDKLSVYKTEQEKCTNTLDKAVSAYQKQEQKVKTLEQALEKAKQEYGENSKEVKKLEEELKKANKALDTKKNSVINANNALTNMNTTISSTEAEIKGMERQIEKTKGALDELENEANDTGDEVEKLGGNFENFSSKLKSVATSAVASFAKISAAMVTAGVGIASVLTKLSIEQYAQYEQLTGGIETLFKNSSNKVMEYANNAYKNAGLSANEYMDTMTSFSASLIAGLGGDTEKAAQIGNMAIEDMSDNANKMGTSMEMIQNAYQGFAKQNYTMLDNLKLGYGGTKEEMQRLLEEASKISGIKYDISNFSDIIEAIHAIQTEMDITGTTAKEASSTIEGSLNMTKSAWTNVLTGIADSNADFDTLINNLVDSVSAFGENIIPRIEIAIQGVGQLVEKLLPPIIQKIPTLITDVLPNLISAGTKMIESLVSGLTQAMPELISGAVQIIGVLADGIIQVAPLLLEAGLQLIVTLGQGLASGLPQMIPTIVDLIVSMCDMFIENLPMFIDVAIEIILSLVQGLINALPTLIAEIPRIINSFCNVIYEKLPDILKVGVDIIIMLVKGLIDSIPVILENLPQIIMAIVNVFTMMNWASIGKSLITNIGSGISSMVGNIGTIAKFTAESVVNGIKGIFTAGGSIGKNLISWVANGISSSLGNLVQAAKNVAISAIQGIKNILSWDSASSIGSNLIKGIWNGISNMTGWIINKIGGFADSVVNSIKSFFGIGSSKSKKTSSEQSSSRMLYLNEQEPLLNARTLSLDNIALSGSYYTATTRDSLGANAMIRQVNGAPSNAQALSFDMMMNTMSNILAEMSKSIQDLKSYNDKDLILYTTNNSYLDNKLIASENVKQVIKIIGKSTNNYRVGKGGLKLG